MKTEKVPIDSIKRNPKNPRVIKDDKFRLLVNSILCEHHIAPFFGVGNIAYIPDKKIVGLSKLARTLETFSRRLQNQERITTQVAKFLWDNLNPKGVAVQLSAKHLCMEMRGVKKHNTWTSTSKLIGAFKSNNMARSEFLQLIKN